MAYIRAYIEKCPAYGWQGGPTFKTLIVTMANGREARNAEIADARHSFNVPFQNIKQPEYASIKQMHLICRGMLNNFLFIDQLDHSADDEAFAQADGVQTVFQLSKISSIDGVFYQRNVYAIRSAEITDNNSPVSPTIDYDRGTVTFGVAPASGHVLRWTGEFSLWVRFNQDDLPFSLDNGNGRGKQFINGTVSLIEVPPPGEDE